MILEVCWDGLWTLSLGLSQCHGHSSWLVCEVALTIQSAQVLELECQIKKKESRLFKTGIPKLKRLLLLLLL